MAIDNTRPYSKNLSQRLSRYIGVGPRSPLGPRAQDLGIQALKGHAPWIVKSIDFGETNITTAAAFAATPNNVTVTDKNTATSPTIGANSANGYVLINTGSKADSGYNLQWNVANVTSPLMQFIALTQNSTISASRDLFWNIRCAFSCGASVWGTADSGKVFMGMAATDTDIMPNATGVITQATLDQGIGFEISELGVISMICTETAGNTITRKAQEAPFPYDEIVGGVSVPTALSMASTFGTGGVPLSHTSPTTFTAAHFHDWSFYAHWEDLGATNAKCFVEYYFDGKLIGTISGAAKLPDISTASGTDLYNTIEIVNGAATGLVDMAVAEIINATPRLTVA